MNFPDKDIHWMRQALREAEKAAKKGEIPIGAVLVDDGGVLSRGSNDREKTKNPLNHAEMHVLRRGAKKKGDWRLNGATLYVTLEPCPMCLGALLQARVGCLVFGCADPKRLAASCDFQFPSLAEGKLQGNNHQLRVTSGVLEEECARILKEFFKLRRS